MPRPFSKARDLKRRVGTRPSYDRILIVCEGSKTESNYFEEIKRRERLPSAHVAIVPSNGHTSPMQIVDRAIALFAETPEFERVYAVFDRDQHDSYAAAIEKAELARLKNNERTAVRFEPAVSVPAFELWVLLHFQDVAAFTDRHDIEVKLLRHMPEYKKGANDLFGLISSDNEPKRGLECAKKRAKNLKEKHARLPGTEPYTDIHDLVDYLLNMRTLCEA